MVPERADATCRLCTGLFDSEENYCTNEMSGWLEAYVVLEGDIWTILRMHNQCTRATTEMTTYWQHNLKSHSIDNADEQSYCTLIYS